MPRSYGITNAAPWASAPAVGAAGDMYFNTTSKLLFVSDGTTWSAVNAAAGAAASYYGGTINAKLLSLTNTYELINTIAAPYAVSGFHVSAASSRIMCDVAGRYRVQVMLSAQQGSTASGYCLIKASHKRVSADVRIFERVYNGSAASGFTGPSVEGIVDMLVNDEMEFWGATLVASLSIDARSHVSIMPV